MENTKDVPMFVIVDEPVVRWPVTVSLPAAGGVFTNFQFSVDMRVLSPAEYEALFATAPGVVKDETVGSKLSEIVKLNAEIFQRLITDWDGVSDKNGKVAYSPEKLAEQINGPRGPALSAGLWRAISEIRYGARLGN